MGEHKSGPKRPPVIQWRDLPPIQKNAYDALVQLHTVARQIVTDSPKDFGDFANFVLIKGIQVVDSWMNARLTEQVRENANKPTVEIVQPGLQQDDVLSIVKALEGKE